MNDKYYSLLSLLEFLTSRSSLAEESRIWLSRNIKLATRIQNVQARDTIFKCITCDCQTIKRSLRPFNLVACLFITSEAGRRRPPALFLFFQIWQLPLVFAFSRDHEINWTSSNGVSCCFAVIVVFFDDKHTSSSSHCVDNWYLLTFTSWMLT